MWDSRPTNQSQFLIYQDPKWIIKIDVRFDHNDVWLSQRLMAELFGVTKQNISLHIQHIIEEWEIDPKTTIKEYLTVQTEWNREVSRSIEFYNLDMIISVWYRVSSKQATQFRIRATGKLKEYIIKWFVLDDERLKNPDLPFDYFEELSQRIQDIRTSEKRFYRKITDIYATSIDYDPNDEQSKLFFQTVQNKVHYAITWYTAAEIISYRVDANKTNMGLTNFRGSQIRKSDISVAKNYLQEDELSQLNNLVEQYLIFAQWQAQRRIPMKMQDWIEKLHGFLQINDRDILQNSGNISHEDAIHKADTEFDRYMSQQNDVSWYDEFDEYIEQFLPSKK